LPNPSADIAEKLFDLGHGRDYAALGKLGSQPANIALSRKSNGSPTVITSSEMSVYLTDARRFRVSLLFMGAS
jgi:hypothetical protein